MRSRRPAASSGRGPAPSEGRARRRRGETAAAATSASARPPVRPPCPARSGRHSRVVEPWVPYSPCHGPDPARSRRPGADRDGRRDRLGHGCDGALEALIESDFMGAYRTGAASAVAARALARPGPATVAMIGAGWQAGTQALAISRVLEIKELRVFSRHDERRAEFAREQEAQLGVATIASGSAELAVRGADVVVTMTTSKTPVIEADWVEPHALVIAAGSNWHNKAEVPADLVARAQTIVVDQLAAAQLESGDLIAAHAAGKFEWSRAVELGAVLAGKWQRPESSGVSLFQSHGLALWDLAPGSVVLAAARRRGLGAGGGLF